MSLVSSCAGHQGTVVGNPLERRAKRERLNRSGGRVVAFGEAVDGSPGGAGGARIR